MAKITLTEALAETKLLVKKIRQKQAALMDRTALNPGYKDPYEEQGGTTEFNRREMQSIKDMEQRLVTIRALIQIANQTEQVRIGKKVSTIHGWLIWRREVAPTRIDFLEGLVRTARSHMRRKTMVGDKEMSAEIVVDLPAIEAELEELTETLGVLDGRLSLHNATATIELPD